MLAEIDHTSTLSPSSTTDAQAWFERLYGDKPLSRGRICIHGNAKFDKPEYFSSGADAAERCDDFEHDVYALIGVTTSISNHGRGKAEDVVALPALFVDVDCYGGKGPDTVDEAVAILDTLPMKPNLIVASGGGVHAYWVFAEPWYFESAADAKNLLYGWLCQVDAGMKAANESWKLDSVFDLARVLRVPGFVNSKKVGQRSSLIRDTVESYTPDDFANFAKPPAAKVDTSGIELDEVEIDSTTMALLADSNTYLGYLWSKNDDVCPSDDSQSTWDLAILTQCVALGIGDDATLWAVIRSYRAGHCDDDKGQMKGWRADYARTTIVKAKANAAGWPPRTLPTEDFENITIDIGA